MCACSHHTQVTVVCVRVCACVCVCVRRDISYDMGREGYRVQCFSCTRRILTPTIMDNMISGTYKFCSDCTPGRLLCNECISKDHSEHSTDTKRPLYTWKSFTAMYIKWYDGEQAPTKRQRTTSRVEKETVLTYTDWPHVPAPVCVGEGAGVCGVGVNEPVPMSMGVVAPVGVSVPAVDEPVLYPSKPLTLLEKEAALCAAFVYLGVDPSDVARVDEALRGLQNAPALIRPADMAGTLTGMRCISCRTNITICCYSLEKLGQLMVDNDHKPMVACLACGERVQVNDMGVGDIIERAMDVKSGVVPPVTHTVKLTKCRVVTDHEAQYMCQLLREAREMAVKPLTSVVLEWGHDRPQLTGGYTVHVGNQRQMIIQKAQVVELMKQLSKEDFQKQGIKGYRQWDKMFEQIFVKGEVYAKPTINKGTVLHELIRSIRVGEWGIDTTDGLLVSQINVFDSTLALLGTTGTFTWFHCDRDPAQNFAVGVTTDDHLVDESTVLAMWVLIHPDKAAVADEWLCVHVADDGFRHDALSITPTPTKADMVKLRDHVGVDERGRYYVVILEQRPGDMVHVPAGWIHCVINMASNFKLAWDYMNPRELPLYTRVWREILTKITTNGEDYGGTMVSLPTMLLRIQLSEVRKLLPMYR